MGLEFNEVERYIGQLMLERLDLMKQIKRLKKENESLKNDEKNLEPQD